MSDVLHHFLSHYLLTTPLDSAFSGTRPSAAVLVPIINHPQAPTLLFTRRSQQLRHHPGQVAFPGGKYDLTDRSLYETALRETYEEVGISPHFIELLGELPPVNSRSGHSVKPFIAIVQPGFTLTPNHDEVAEVFEVPFTYVLDPHNYVSLSLGAPHAQRQVDFLVYSPQLIWGMTATILRQLTSHSMISPASVKNEH